MLRSPIWEVGTIKFFKKSIFFIFSWCVDILWFVTLCHSSRTNETVSISYKKAQISFNCQRPIVYFLSNYMLYLKKNLSQKKDLSY